MTNWRERLTRFCLVALVGMFEVLASGAYRDWTSSTNSQSSLAHEILHRLSCRRVASIQYIAYQIQTAAKGNLSRTAYPGLSNESSDIQARAKIMLDAIEAAAASPYINSMATKLFMAPEFFFRGGRGGAYAIARISEINKFFDTYLDASKYKKWIFVLGTTIGRMPQHSDGKQEILNIAIVRKGGVKVTSTSLSSKDSILVYKEYVSAIDYLGQFFGDGAEFMWSSVNAGKANVGGEERRLIPTSGSRPTAKVKSPDTPNLVSQAKKWTPSLSLQLQVQAKVVRGEITKGERDAILTPVDYTISETSASGLGGGILFDMDGIRFVLEVCLDHGQKRAQGACAANDSDVHLITSCGMTASYGWVKTGGHLFRCDGIGATKKQINASTLTGAGWVDVPLKEDIDMTKKSRWKRFPASGTNLFQAGRGKVYVFGPKTLP